MPPITPSPYHVSSFNWDFFFFLRFGAITPIYQKGLIKVHFCNVPLEENKRAQEVHFNQTFLVDWCYSSES